MPISKEAVEHRANAEDGHAISGTEVVLRLRARRGDCRAVTLVYIDKYRYIFDFHGHFSDRFHDLPMERFASDERFDFYQVRLVHDMLAINYYFQLEGEDGGEALCFGDHGFFEPAQLGPGQLFTMPLLQEDDVYVVPAWAHEAVVYQIFVDSFYPGNGRGGGRGDGHQVRPGALDWYSRERHRGHLGGTLQGIGKFLKEHRPGVRIAAVEPKNVSALLGHEPGLHQIQGIGDGFIPDVLDKSLVDEVIEVSDEDAIATTRELSRDLGLLVGISSGANVWGARRMAEKISGNIATVLPDRAERYFSTTLM